MIKTRWMDVGVLVVAGLVGCDAMKEKMGKSDDAGASTASTAKPAGTAAKPAASAAPASAAAKQEENLFSAAAGAMLVEEPAEKNNYDPWNMLDDNQRSYWMVGKPGTYAIVVSLPQPTTLKQIFWRGGAKKVTIEATASTDAKTGLQKIAEAELAEPEMNHSSGDGTLQAVGITKALSARVFRITIVTTKEYSQSNDLVGYGTKDAPPAFPANITGLYSPMEESLGDFRIKQEGQSVKGCVASYEFTGEVTEGLVKGRWWNVNAPTENGPAAFNVTLDGSKIAFFRYAGSPGTLFARVAPKKGADPGTCPSWKTTKEDPMVDEIARFGRARIYGIRFDTDSDVIKPESKPVLDRVAAVLAAKPDWKMLVEGHTDDTSTPAYNQTLSEKRANAVKKALESRGIAAARLTAVGLGQTKPIAPNDSSMGRAENRRVELAKQ